MIPAASFRSRVSFILLGLVLLAAKVDMHAVAPASRAEFAIAKVSESSIVRNLTPAEMAADQHAHIALGLRNKTELDARVAHGEIISREEMAARYYPTRETWASVAAWAAGQGLAVAPEDLTHMTVFTHGTVAQVGRAFQTRFARVRGTDRREYSSAIDAPSMPLEVSAPVTGIMALQPHLRRKPHAVYTTIGSGHATPPQFIRDWYNATSVGDGSGQVIGIWGYDNPPNSTDLMNYWWKIGSGHTMSDISVYNPDNLPPCADTEFDGAGFEMTLDTEVASGLCSGANIRIYCVGNEGSLAAQVLKDLAAGIPVRQLATSFGAPETLNGGDGPAAAQYFASLSQYFEALTAQGVTCFAASGDGGSNENGHGSGYDPSGALAPEYPASDPYVTGVGGTDVNLLYNSTGTTITGVQSEFAWTPETGVVSNGQLVPSVPINSSCSGGGISAVIARPSWQQGPGVPAGAMRCVPDVAAGPANGNGLYLYIGGDATAGGTSVSSPIWAAMCACMNQALAAKGQGPIGLLGPKLYPLTGTPALKAMAKGYFETYAGTSIAFSGPNDVIVSDGPSTNGAYAVGPNYNCITGLGTPNVARILDALLSASSVPFVRSGPQAQSVNAGAAVTLSVDCGGGGLSYQWALNGSPIEGATNATLVYPAIAAYQAGNYSCTITNSYGSVSTSATAVAVASNARLVDISARANVGTGDNVLIAGLWISTDSQSVPKNILVRCMGPSIGQAPFNVSGTLANTSMSFYKSETELVSEQGWGATTLLQSYGPTAGYTFTSASQNLMAILGAFAPYEVGSGDAATCLLPIACYSLQQFPNYAKGFSLAAFVPAIRPYTVVEPVAFPPNRLSP